jgi:hypothetical protein
MRSKRDLNTLNADADPTRGKFHYRHCYEKANSIGFGWAAHVHHLFQTLSALLAHPFGSMAEDHSSL